ncbi:IclR family transcriptional regulator [Streptomyces spectabilis]|uniref:Glycerol operon regulatory protein n=1 Tax=Streptomyces spectabilis TaxID=68270 RepID=A0A7W8EWI7_STRST|nr:IclR family transcriptional regulator [Streptomyces spectabilis]MBB5105700.1 DNA-binding IclR family transcriptional regulator [Streptomyces spectabilis]MCI3901234.1 IclR family transcriptional regulator [Streptomyces spectabilis]GGV23589.1 IclR family transcriptional regulator [Streptomyces spectabilis]
MTRTPKSPDQTEEPRQDAAKTGRSRARQSRAAAGSVQSVDRAVSVLEILARHGEAGVTEIADELGVHKSTAFRLLGVLENRGLVGQAKDRGKYFLGAGVLRLAGAAAVRMDISQEGGPVCRELADELGETVNIAVLDDDAAVNIMQARGPASVTAQNWLGRRTPLHATSSGKVLLAHLPTTLREGLVARTLPRLTERTVTGTVALRGELETVVERGFATAVEEFEVGLAAVAAPVRAHDGKVIGALSASGPVYRLTEDRLTELAKRTVAAAVDLSRRMGYGL